MSMTLRTWCSAGLLAAVAALGCQPAPATAPEAAQRPVRVHDGLALGPGTDMAITLDRGCDQAYGLQQVASGLDPRIAYFLVRITGPSYPAPQGRVTRIDAASFTGCLKVLDFDGLFPGRYQVVLDARDAQDQYLWGRPGEVDVATGGQPAQLTLSCQYRSLPISPTPWPNPTPVPTSTPGPTAPPPSPTPNPCLAPGSASYPAAQVPNPAAHFERIHGLHADALGRVYLLGLKPSPWPADLVEIGRSARVDQQGTVFPFTRRTTLWNAEHPAFELEPTAGALQTCVPEGWQGFFGVKLNTPVGRPNSPLQSANQSYQRIDNGMQVVGYLGDPDAGDFVRPWGAATHLPGGGIWIAPGMRDPAKLAGYSILLYGNPLVDRRALLGGRTAAVERPLSMIHDRVNNVPIWTSKRGVLTLAKVNKPKDPPKVLVDRPVYGIARVAPLPYLTANRSNQVLLTTYTAGEQDVYHVDLDAHRGTPAKQADVKVAFHFTAGIPHRIEQGVDGRFYVLLQQGPLPTDATAGMTSSGGGDGGDPYFHEFPGTNRIRVVQLRWDAVNKRLYDPRMVADSFTNPAPSF